MSAAYSNDILEKFRSLVKKIKAYEEALGVLYWDMRTGAPRKGMEARSEVVGSLSGEMFRLSTSEEMGSYLDELSRPEVLEQLDEVNRVMVHECRKEYERSKRIPPDRYEAYVVLTSQSEAAWEEAKDRDDFAAFLPYLEQVIAFNHEFVELWGWEGHKYNTLLDLFEPGITVEQLDSVFDQLKASLVPLVSAIQQSASKPRTDLLKGTFPKEKQRRFSEFILSEMGFDFAAGRLDLSVHPFATGLNPGDVRITTNYMEHDLTFSLFSSIHEGGHALYEQNISDDLIGTVLCTGTSMGIHESQSRFWENMVGRSKPFWHRYYSDLQQSFPESFGATPLDDFYHAINVVEPSLIRIEADEVTYNLHIIIRYELEKAIFEGKLKAADLPDAWNALYREYLGIEPSSYRDGVMQDVHWSAGLFGYFPSYSLGNMYAAQIMHSMRRSMPDVDERIASGNLISLKSWLSERIYQYGKLLTPNEIIERVTGEPLNPAYLAEYFQHKFAPIYDLT